MLSGLRFSLFQQRPAMDQIADALAYEIKHEIATRYFGFRKNIETITAGFQVRLSQYSRGIQEKLGRDIRRIHHLFPAREHFQAAIEMAGLPLEFTTRTLNDTPEETKDELFAGFSRSGFTRRGRYLHLGKQVYATLLDHLDEYQELFADLSDEQQEIARRIKAFETNNDLSGILGFFRGLDSSRWQADVLQSDSVIGADQLLANDLRIPVPPAVSTVMPHLHQPPEFTKISRSLDRLLKLSYHYQNNTPLSSG